MTELAVETTILEQIRALHPAIAGRAGEIEQKRRVPLDLLDDLTAAGCFRVSVPRSHGGIELRLVDQLRALEELGSADASTGWTVMIGNLAPLLATKLSEDAFDALYAGGPDVIMAGVFNPTGVATPVDGGFRVTGRWSFASGCEHAHWFAGHSFVDDGREPPVRMMLMPRADIEIDDTWWVSGLCGTGSHDVHVEEVFVPAEHTFTLWDEPWHASPLFRIPELAFSTLACAALATGIAGGAMDDITGMAAGKVPAFAPGRLAANPLFQTGLGEADARLRAARATLQREAEDTWETAANGRMFTPAHRARIRGTATWVLETSASVVDWAYTAGGGGAIYADRPLQRRLRDIRAMTQHFAVKHDTFTKVGAVMMDEEVDLDFL